VYATLAAAAAASAALAAYGMMSPRSQLFGRQLYQLEAGGRKLCALTFDDGPQEPYTSRLLDVLGAQRVPATFFVLGRQAECHPDTLARLRAEGHEVGIHGYSHAAMPFMGRARLAEELDRALDVVGPARLVRPPYGWKDPRLFALARERGLTVVGWSAHGADWRRHSPQAIAGKIMGRLRPGGIVLLHDGCGEDATEGRTRSVEAAAILTRELKRQGWEFVKL